MKLCFLPSILALACCFNTPSFGQAFAPSLVSFGYRLPADSIAAAPGQVLLVSIRGIQPFLVGPGGASPSQAGAVTAEVSQGGGGEIIPVSIQGLRQTRCSEPPPAAPGCQPVTSLLVRIPPAFRNLSVLRIRDKGAVASEIVLRRVEDAIHIVSSCDELRVVAGVAEETPSSPTAAASCRAATGGGGRFDEPARAGAPLFLWAYGLGDVDRPYPDNAPHQPELFPRATQPVTINFSFVGPGPLSERRVTGIVPAYAGMISRDGLYQINFFVPPVPPGTPACSATPGDFNATVTLVGTDSADAVRLCVAP